MIIGAIIIAAATPWLDGPGCAVAAPYGEAANAAKQHSSQSQRRLSPGRPAANLRRQASRF
jgi:hypothetical protein